MDKVKELVQHVSDQQSIQFGEKLKELVHEKLSVHPRMVAHNNTINQYDEQQQIYSKIDSLHNPDME